MSRNGDVMKNYPRFFFGVLSSLLFAVGLVRAANAVDPLAKDLPDASSRATMKAAADCSNLCDFADRSS